MSGHVGATHEAGGRRATIRVLVVDDSALVRQILLDALALDPRIEVVGVARNGVQAIEVARELDPDVITLDIEMPELTGLEALPHLRSVSDARIVMLSSLDDSETMYQALALGAVDFVAKPKGRLTVSMGELCEQLQKTIRTAYRVSPDAVAIDGDAIARTMAAILQRSAPPRDNQPEETSTGAISKIAVAIAASTGGPPALEQVFAGLTSDLPAAVLVVQHLPRGFSASLARRLSRAGSVPVVEAEEGTALRNGCGYLAPHGAHMCVEVDASGPHITFDRRQGPLHGVCPAADVLFESVVDVFGEMGVGVVLTGMGTDGAKGLRRMRDEGGATVVQDEETSVVWGMPGAALREKAANRTVAIGSIPAEIRRAVRARELSDE